MPFVKLARVEEIPPGRTKYVAREPAPIVLANFEGTVYALYGLCSHQNRPLDGAILWGHLLDCPWHHFQYDCRTGENFFPKNVYPQTIERLQQQVRSLKRYSVEVRDGDVWVNVE